MKKELSSIDLSYVLKELDVLINSRVDKVFNIGKKEVLIQFYVSGRGKYILRILPNFIYLTSSKKIAETPSGFCMFLRKYLNNVRLRKISQINSERVVEFLFESKEGNLILIAEFFSKGNIILCDKNYKIINLLERQRWKDRELKQGIKYKQPKSKINFFSIKEKEFRDTLKSDKILVKKLAVDVSLGGVYAEEVCLLSNIDKNKKELSSEELKRILSAIKKILNKKISPLIVFERDDIIDVIPFDLQFYKDFEKKKFKSYNDALDFVLSKESGIETKKTEKYEKQIKKLDIIIENQRKHIVEIEKDIKDESEKAECIYQNYNIISEILYEMNKAKEKLSWDEIKKRLKGHKTIKEINVKDKKVVLELK